MRPPRLGPCRLPAGPRRVPGCSMVCAGPGTDRTPVTRDSVSGVRRRTRRRTGAAAAGLRALAAEMNTRRIGRPGPPGHAAGHGAGARAVTAGPRR
eukprot:767494-Hanusia_phi.AAC.2